MSAAEARLSGNGSEVVDAAGLGCGGASVNVFDASFALPKAGTPGDPTPPIGSATFIAPNPAPWPVIVTYTAGTTIVQHFIPNIALLQVVLQSMLLSQGADKFSVHRALRSDSMVEMRHRKHDSQLAAELQK